MKTKRTSESGMALVMALFFAGISVALVGVLTASLMSQRNLVNRSLIKKECFDGVEAAYASCKAKLQNGEEGKVGLDGWTAAKPFVLPSFTTSGITPVHMSTLPNVQYFSIAQNWFNDGIDNNKNGVLDAADSAEFQKYTIHSFARNQGQIRQTEAVVVATDINVWRNAIFAGNGQAGGLINGNVSIHGSVHLLGANLADTTMAIAAIDLSGTSMVHNNYGGLDATLRSMVPTLPTVSLGGETVETLNANLRVKNGTVGLSGNSEIGQPNATGNTTKEMMDGTYVNDGWTGNKSTPTADGRGMPTSVYSDNGYNNKYDVGDLVPFPTLDSDYRSPGTGAKVWNNATGKYYTHDEYFTQVLVASPGNPTDGILNQSLSLDVSGQAKTALYWNATKNVLSTGGTNAAPSAVAAYAAAATAPVSTDDYMYFNPATNLLVINGQIKINGGLTIVGQGNDKTVNYTGRGSIMATQDVALDTNLLSCNNGNTGSYANSFPVNNFFGIMTRTNMNVGTTSQLNLVGAFYAMGTIKTTKQSNIMGTFVASYFDMGTNVPSIYQVPSLADNLPLGMIGNYPILAMQQVTWREMT